MSSAPSPEADVAVPPHAPITAVDVRYMALPTGIKPFVLPNGHRTPTDLAALLVRLTDESGRTGTSLLWSQRQPQLGVMEAAVRYLAGSVVGMQPTPVGGYVAAMRQHATFLGQDGAIAFGVSGIEMALQDLACRTAGANLSVQLGRRRDRVRAYQTGLMLPATIDELVEEAAGILDRGIRAIKMIVGKPTVAEDVERVRAVRESLPADASLMVDALQRWTLPQSLEAAVALEPFGLEWIEDPMPHHDIAQYRELIATSPIPISTGETAFSRAAFEELLDAGVPYVIAELERSGGISGWMALAERVHERSAVLLPHIYPHVSAQLVAAIPQDSGWWEYVPWFDQLCTEPFDITDGWLTVPRASGTGFDPDPDAVERLALGPWIAASAKQ